MVAPTRKPRRRRSLFAEVPAPAPVPASFEPWPFVSPDEWESWLFVRTAWKARACDLSPRRGVADLCRLAVAEWLERMDCPIRAAAVREAMKAGDRERADEILFPAEAEYMLEGVEFE